MKNKIFGLLIIFLLGSAGYVFFGKPKAQHEEVQHHEESENSAVGENKGILEADEEEGFILSDQAKKNFAIKTAKVSSLSNFKIPKNAVLHSLEERNIYRVRNNFIKRIDFKIENTDSENFLVKSSELAVNDEVIVSGIGFVRITEIAAFGGNEEGHSH